MPVEVRQVSIKANVTSGKEDMPKQPLKPFNGQGGISYREREAIIQDCIAAVFEKLEDQNHR